MAPVTIQPTSFSQSEVEWAGNVFHDFPNESQADKDVAEQIARELLSRYDMVVAQLKAKLPGPVQQIDPSAVVDGRAQTLNVVKAEMLRSGVRKLWAYDDLAYVSVVVAPAHMTAVATAIKTNPPDPFRIVRVSDFHGNPAAFKYRGIRILMSYRDPGRENRLLCGLKAEVHVVHR